MNETEAKIQAGKGILLCLLLYIAFYAIAVSAMHIHGLSGTAWYLFSSAQRILFGLFSMWLLVSIFHRENFHSVIHTRGLRDGFRAGTAILALMAMMIITIAFSVKEFKETSVLTLISCLLIQQLSTGFWEETAFRGFVCEGYWQRKSFTRKERIIYAAVSFVLFGLIHAVEAESVGFALYRFLTTGAMGFGFAAMYLYSGCLLAPMLLHFFYDIAANISRFVAEWQDSTFFYMMNDWILPAVYAVIFIAAIVYLIKEPVYVRNDIVKCDENKISA